MRSVLELSRPLYSRSCSVHSKYPPAEPEALCFEPLKGAGAFVAHANFPFWSYSYERLCPKFSSLSGNSGDFHHLAHLCHSPTFQNRKPGHTPGNVKLLLPPRQSRGFSLLE
jgi:hypothetical protein